MEDGGLVHDTPIRQTKILTTSSQPQPQDSDQMPRRAKRPPNKKKKRKGNYPSLMHDNNGGSKDSEGNQCIKKNLTYTNTPSLELEKIDDDIEEEPAEAKRLINKNDKPAPMPDDDDIGVGSILYDQSQVLPKEKAGSSVWTKEDEITILKGLVKFQTGKGTKSKPIDYIEVYESIKQSLHRESATKIDLQKKVKCLREKYKNNLKRERTPSVPHEEELFYLSDKIWGGGIKDHEIKQQFTCQSSTCSSSSIIIRPCKNLDLEATDKIFVGDLGLALAAINRNQSNPVQVALEQFKLVSQSLSTRKSYSNQILEARITPKELSELEEQKIARSYFDTKIQHARLVLDAYSAIHDFENSLINISTDCGLKEDTPEAMNEGNCPPATIGCRKPITEEPSNTSPKSVSQMCHSGERKEEKKRKIENQENHCDTSPKSVSQMSHSQESKEKEKKKIENQENHCDTSPKSVSQMFPYQERKEKKKKKIKNQENHCDTSPKSASQMCHSQERTEKKKKKIENEENHCDTSIPSHTVATSKVINESATSSPIRTLPDGMTVEVLVKGKLEGKVASIGKKVKIYFYAKLRDTECFVGSNIIADGPPHKFCLGHKKALKGLNIGIEGMHIGEKRRLIIPPSLGPGSKAKPPILPDSWLVYDVELVDICD